MNIQRTSLVALAVAFGSVVAQASSSVLLTNISNPGVTDEVPGFPSDTFRAAPTSTDGNSFFNLTVSANGSWWGLRAFLTGITTGGINSMFVGSGGTRSTFKQIARVGDPAPFPAGPFATINAIGNQVAVNNIGDGLFRVNLADGVTTSGLPESLIRSSGSGSAQIAKTGDPLPGFSGLTFLDFDSPNFRADGATAAFRTRPQGFGTGAATGSVLYDFSTPYAVAPGSGATTTVAAFVPSATIPLPLTGEGTRSSQTQTLNSFRVSGNGQNFIYQAILVNVAPETGTSPAVIFNNRVVVRQGGPVNGTSALAQTIGTAAVPQVSNAGWATRFALNDGTTDANRTDVVYANGSILAKTGDVIGTNLTETWSDDFAATPQTQTFGNVSINNFGEILVSGWTNASSNAEVLVLNDRYKQLVVARAGDPIDLDGNGSNDDDAFISFFATDRAVLADNLAAYYVVRVVDGANVVRGQAVIRQLLPIPGDVDGTGEVDLTDIDQIIANYLTSNAAFDIDLNGEVDLTDVDIAIANYLRAW